MFKFYKLDFIVATGFQQCSIVGKVGRPKNNIPVQPLTLLEKVAGVTGLEPAASGVTGPKKAQKTKQLQTLKYHKKP